MLTACSTLLALYIYIYIYIYDIIFSSVGFTRFDCCICEVISVVSCNQNRNLLHSATASQLVTDSHLTISWVVVSYSTSTASLYSEHLSIRDCPITTCLGTIFDNCMHDSVISWSQVMANIYSFDGLIIFGLLMICTCAYLRGVPKIKQLFFSEKSGVFGALYKASVIGTRLHWAVSICCVTMAIYILFIK